MIDINLVMIGNHYLSLSQFFNTHEQHDAFWACRCSQLWCFIFDHELWWSNIKRLSRNSTTSWGSKFWFNVLLSRKLYHIYWERPKNPCILYTYSKLGKLHLNFSHSASNMSYNLQKLARAQETYHKTKELLKTFAKSYSAISLLYNLHLRFNMFFFHRKIFSMSTWTFHGFHIP